MMNGTFPALIFGLLIGSIILFFSVKSVETERIGFAIGDPNIVKVQEGEIWTPVPIVLPPSSIFQE